MALLHLLQSYFWGLSEITSALPAHLVDVPPVGDSAQTVSEISGMYMKNTPPMITNVVNNQGALMQVR
ncbi:hypothetical protein Tco_1026968 [Tanacetum coccineum]